MNKKIAVFFVCAGLLSANAFAADGCTDPKTSYDATYCKGKLFIESDKELNETYNSLRSIIPNDVKKQLVTAQRNWIHYRDNACSMYGAINVECNYKVNKARITYLQDRLRECKTGHCQNKLVADTNFDKPNEDI